MNNNEILRIEIRPCHSRTSSRVYLNKVICDMPIENTSLYFHQLMTTYKYCESLKIDVEYSPPKLNFIHNNIYISQYLPKLKTLNLKIDYSIANFNDIIYDIFKLVHLERLTLNINVGKYGFSTNEIINKLIKMIKFNKLTNLKFLYFHCFDWFTNFGRSNISYISPIFKLSNLEDLIIINYNFENFILDNWHYIKYLENLKSLCIQSSKYMKDIHIHNNKYYTEKNNIKMLVKILGKIYFKNMNELTLIVDYKLPPRIGKLSTIDFGVFLYEHTYIRHKPIQLKLMDKILFNKII